MRLIYIIGTDESFFITRFQLQSIGLGHIKVFGEFLAFAR